MKITQDNILSATPVVLDILDNWRLDSKQIMRILALDGVSPLRDLAKFRKNMKALPFSEDMAERVGHIFGIADAMRTSYPFNAEICATWLRQPHRRFAKATPLELIMTEDMAGLLRVRVELDCAYGWSLFEDEFNKNNANPK